MYERRLGSQTIHDILFDCNPSAARMSSESTSRIEEEFTVISMVERSVSATADESWWCGEISVLCSLARAVARLQPVVNIWKIIQQHSGILLYNQGGASAPLSVSVFVWAAQLLMPREQPQVDSVGRFPDVFMATQAGYFGEVDNLPLLLWRQTLQADLSQVMMFSWTQLMGFLCLNLSRL